MRCYREVAAAFVGTHDFTQFSNKPWEPGANGNPVKRVVRCDVVELPDGFRVEVQASGFLYRQVGDCASKYALSMARS